MKKKASRVSLALLAFFLSVMAYLPNASADCASCDELPDDGKCNRSGITKRCVITSGWEDDNCVWFWSVKGECPIPDD